MSPEQRYLPLLHLRRTRRIQRAAKSGGPGRGVRKPTPDRQDERLTPQFQRLQEALEARRLELRQEVAGAEPEMVLVLETVGSIDDFLRAVRKIESFEWLAELDTELDPDADFYDAKDKERRLAGSVYLVMTDQRALQSLLSLWNRWRRAPDRAFGHGWNRWRQLFLQLHDIRPWSAEDRLRETGLLEIWRERLAAGEVSLRTEIELWPRRASWSRRSAETLIERYVTAVGGKVISQAAIPEIAYHGVLAELPAAAAAQILELSPDVQLVRCEEVMFFRPVGQMTTPPSPDEAGPEAGATSPLPETPSTPTIALLDGLPLERHRHLDGRLRVDDPDAWAAQIPADQRHHGTAMASLILHGDLAGQEPPLERPIYVRPVLKPTAQGEGIPEDVLPVDYLRRAIRRLFKGEDGQSPGVAPGVHVVNLSIGDPWQPFDRRVSSLARLLDWLAWEHQLLIVVSAGNHIEAIQLEQDVSQLQPHELQAVFWNALRDRAHLQRLLSPAEGINLLTVGAEHNDAGGSYPADSRLNPAVAASDEMVPSPITSWGPGPGRAIKPDLLMPGGRQLYRQDPGMRLSISRASAIRPGQQVASAHQAASLARTSYTTGTSNAAALASRAAGQLLDILPELIADFDEPPHRRVIAPLLKALLVHGAAWGAAREFCDKLLGTRTRSEVGRFLGFGFADVSRVFSCTDSRVTLVAWGEVRQERGDVYTIPLPFGLSGVKGARRLITTLAWLTPTNARDRRYRQADLWVSLGGNDTGPKPKLGVDRAEADFNAAMRGTVHHEIWEGEKAAAFAETDELSLQVNCREHASGLGETHVPYGLLVTLEVAPELGVQVYEEVRAKIATRVRVGVSVSISS